MGDVLCATSADSLIPNVTCKAIKLLQIYISLTLVFLSSGRSHLQI